MTERNSTSGAAYFLGFDGGGTKTECVLADAQGETLSRATAGPSNPLRAGYPAAQLALADASGVLLERQKIVPSDVRGICAGIAGASRASVADRLRAFLQESFPRAEVKVTTDIDIAFSAAFGCGAGIILVAGTGSGALGRDSMGRRVHVGGKGPWFSDEGSAFDIGRRAVQAALLADENRGPVTELSRRLFEYLEARDWNDVIDQVRKAPDAVFPRVFPLVAELAEADDAVSREILSTAAAALATLARSVAEALGWRGANTSANARAEIRIAHIGGMHGRSRFLDTALNAELSRAVTGWKHADLLMSPAEAAARIAARGSRNATIG